VASAMTDEVLRYDRASGEFMGAFVTAGLGGLDEPYDVVVGPMGDVFVSSRSQGVIYRYSATGEFLKLFGVVGEGLRGLAFDHRGDLLACSWNGPFGSGLYRFDGATGEFYGLVANVLAPMFVAVQ